MKLTTVVGLLFLCGYAHSLPTLLRSDSTKNVHDEEKLTGSSGMEIEDVPERGHRLERVRRLFRSKPRFGLAERVLNDGLEIEPSTNEPKVDPTTSTPCPFKPIFGHIFGKLSKRPSMPAAADGKSESSSALFASSRTRRHVQANTVDSTDGEDDKAEVKDSAFEDLSKTDNSRLNDIVSARSVRHRRGLGGRARANFWTGHDHDLEWRHSVTNREAEPATKNVCSCVAKSKFRQRRAEFRRRRVAWRIQRRRDLKRELARQQAERSKRVVDPEDPPTRWDLEALETKAR